MMPTKPYATASLPKTTEKYFTIPTDKWNTPRNTIVIPVRVKATTLISGLTTSSTFFLIIF
jgi:hypothetical protein